jgi:hypothetical protein
VNRGGLNLDHKLDPAKQKMAYYPANAMPVPNDLNPQPADRKAAMAAAAALESPAQAIARHAWGGPAPAQYTPTPPNAGGPRGEDIKPAVYGGGGRKVGS